MDGRSIFPTLMPFLFQQGLFDDQPEAVAGDVEVEWSDGFQAVDRVPGVPGCAADEEGDLQSRLRVLRTQRAELQAKLERGAQRENEVLTSKVVSAQQEFLALQGEFKTIKEEYNQQLEGLRSELEEQQGAADRADRRVKCAEDLVRFHQEQRRMMASHWKQQCQVKDESIRNLNRRLIEYSTDWQHLGLQRQTEAGLSHEYFCLDDRHQRLLDRQQKLQVMTSRLRLQARLEEVEAQEQRKTTENCAGDCAEQAASEAEAVSLALGKLREKRQSYEEVAVEQALPGSHRCIWRDELDVREGQLEKIQAEEQHIVAALERIQGALAEHSAKHQEMQLRHSEAEAKLRESERLRSQRQRRCQELHRSEAALRRLLEVVEGDVRGSKLTSSPVSPVRAPLGRDMAPASRPVAVALAALAAVLAWSNWTSSGFVPPPQVPAFPQNAQDVVSAVSLDTLQDCVEDGLDSALTAVDDMFTQVDNLVGPSLNPQLLPAGGVPAQKDGMQQVIEPLIKLYMKYRTAIYPRCKECQIIVRFGKMWRTCRVRRHKARQPGVTTFKKRMNKYQGWKQNTAR